jgi:hypothetical protein
MASTMTEDGAPVESFTAAPDTVTLYAEDLTSPRFTPRELAAVRQHTGKSFSQVLTDEASDDKFTVLAWLKLRRQGLAVEWDQMADVVIGIRAEEATGLDPTNGSLPTISPPSADIGE